MVGLAFSIGLGMEHRNVLADLLGSPWGELLGNGITVGTATALVLTAFLELTSPRRRRLEVRLAIADLPRIDAFLQELLPKYIDAAAPSGCAPRARKPCRVCCSRTTHIQRARPRA